MDVALVHRRLSIIDHAGGHQPMVHDGERLRPDLTYGPGETPKLAHELEKDSPLVAVVFNGCIYNHRELRAELESLGHSLETDHSDTEVLLASVLEWNQSVAMRLEGMYGYGVWDRIGGTLSIQRDPFGEKPIYLSDRKDGNAAFSSCVSGITGLRWSAGDDETPEADSYLRGWIRFGWNQVPPMLCRSMPIFISSGIRLGNAEAEPTFEMSRGPFPTSLELPDGKITANEVDALLRRAVQNRLDADVPVGCFLSGGIDSALIAHYASQIDQGIRCFTVRMPVASFDESHEARDTAAHLGLDHIVLECDPSPAADLVMLIEQLGLPFG
ncbi:MAG: asparagine synthase-related protein, partial [Planctomycetota bacterium]